MIAKCPNCKNELVKIVFTEPTEKEVELAHNKKVYLARDRENRYLGTLKPKYYCYNCNKSFYDKKVNGEYIEYDWIESITLSGAEKYLK